MAKNEAKIKFTAETGEFNDAIKKANDEMSLLRAELKLNETQMKNTGASVEALEKQHSLLERQLKASESKTEALSQKVQKAAEIYGENSTEVTKLKTQLTNAQTAEEKVKKAIADCNREMEDQKQTADKLDKSLDDVAESAANTEDGFTIAKGAVADFVSNAVQAAIGKVSEFIGWLTELPEATREIRQDMATLETSFETAGLTTEQATDTWKELYKVFGEDDRAVEAANLIAKFADNQKDLNDWVTITKGVWGSYSDSLPVEGLAEASNETAKTGQVTGVLADALNWSSEAATMFAGYMSEDVTTAEDAFNVALSECTTEQERQALITETLTALYGDAAVKYDEASGAQTEAKEAAAENILVQNELAETVEPLTTAWEGMKTEILSGIMPAVKQFSEWGINALGWMKEHPVLMKTLAAVFGVVAVALGALVAVVTAYTVAQWAMNAAVLANPITWIIVGIVAAIAAVVAIIVVVIEYWDQIVVAVQNACAAVTSALQTAWEWVQNVFSTIAEWINTNVIQPVVNFFTGLWESIKSIWDNICNAIQVAIQFIGSIISAAVDIITLPFQFIWENCKEYVFAAWEWIKNAVSTAINAVKDTITNVMNAIKGFLSPILEAIKNVFSTAWNAIKTAVTTVLNAIKSAVTTAWNAIKTAVTTVMNGIKSGVSTAWNAIKNTVSNVVNGIKSAVSTGFNAVKSTVSRVWDSIKSAIEKPINKAKETVKKVVDSIKGFFDNLKIKFPDIKLPHFKITGKFSLDPPSVPKLGIEWYAKAVSSPMILNSPTIFGAANGKLLGGGEAGSEMIGGTNTVMQMIQNAVDKSMQAMNLSTLAAAIEDLANRPIELDINGRQFALATAGDSDRVNGMRNRIIERGVLLD